ncbi:BT4734/BF3469 family protein, partial [Bacteroides xylanisolvens]
MKALEEIKVSVYENVYSKKPKVMSFLEVIIMCIHPVYASIINAIRRYYAEGDHAAAQKLKSQLPCFTPAGTFDGAHAIKNFLLPSHIVGLDYDHVKDRLQVIQRCAADPHTVAAIESPTDGVKVFAYVEGIENRHREGQQLVSRYYNQLLGLESDPACKDESRLCYFSYSPNGYVAGLYQAFVLEPHLKEETNASSENKVLPPFPLQDNTPENVSEAEIAQFISSYIFLHPLTAGQRHSNVFKLACEACRRHYPQESILRELTAFFEHTDFRPEELTSVLSSGYKQVNEHAPASSTATSSSFQKDIRTKIPYGTLENSDSTEEAYWLGEEFRKGTPLFPRDLYNNLPDLLNDCIIEDASDREQDISLLSDLTALSAALPQTFGIYNHKKYSPHLFSVIFSSAGSGKSIAQTGRYLLEEIQTEILSTSESMLKNYHTAHNTWQAECQRKRKKGETCSEEPQRPPFKMLFIPATTSYTRMQIQMQDNGSQGSIIFDTEAQTLSTANHLDCGNFDDMLRKA